MKKIFIFSCAVLLLGCSAWAAIDLSEVEVGARPLGMGKTFASGLDDATAIFTNPAGLSLNQNLNLISMSGSMLSDVNYLLLGFSENSPMGKFGFGYLNASVGEIPITSLTGTGSTAAIVQTGSTNYSSSMLFFSYGSKLSRFLRGKFGNVSIGGTLKLFQQGFSGGGSAMDNANGAGMDADLGLTWDMNTCLRGGLVFSNFLPVSFGGKFVWQRNTNDFEPIPLAVRAGLRLALVGRPALFVNEMQNMQFLLDYELGRGGNYPALWHTGVEYSPLETVTIRCGVDQKAKATSLGIGVDNNLTAGLGVNFKGFTFDYAYHRFGDIDQNTTHFFSIGFRGIDAVKKKYQQNETGIASALPPVEVVQKPVLKNFTDVPVDFWAEKPIEYLATLGIMDGYPDMTFQPGKFISRGELAVILTRAKGFDVPTTAQGMFKDVSTKSSLAPYVELACQRGYFSGYSDGTFRPDQSVTRAEAAVIFSKFSGLYVKPKVSAKVYRDVSKSFWASPAIAATKESGYFEYITDNKFNADECINRAEVAEILSKTAVVKEKIKGLLIGEK